MNPARLAYYALTDALAVERAHAQAHDRAWRCADRLKRQCYTETHGRIEVIRIAAEREAAAFAVWEAASIVVDRLERAYLDHLADMAE